jgi:hypothetical protein
MNFQMCINHTKDRNLQVAKWLDRWRYSAALSPLTFTVGAWISP